MFTVVTTNPVTLFILPDQKGSGLTWGLFSVLFSAPDLLTIANARWSTACLAVLCIKHKLVHTMTL